MGSFHFPYDFSIFKSLGLFLFTSFMFKCNSHFRPHCLRHIFWCLFLWVFWFHCLLTSQKPLNVMEIPSWMSSSHEKEDGSSAGTPGELQQFSPTSCCGGVHSGSAAERCHGHCCEQTVLNLLWQSDIVAARSSPALLKEANLICPTSSWFWLASWHP